MNYFAGIDIGSTAIKIALIDEEKNILASKVTPTGSHFRKNAVAALETMLSGCDLTMDDLSYMTSTGYGRKLMKESDESVSEITANAIGAIEAGRAHGDIKTIINIGGQDTKAIQIDDMGTVTNFVMNDKCAAGTGKFLDVTAMNLEIELEELGDYHFNIKGAPLPINSTCVVFAESEIIGLLADGHGKEEIVAGIHYSIAKRTIRLAKRVGLDGNVYFDGGPALNKGLVAAMEDELGKRLVIPEIPQITTALGAAVLALEAYLDEEEAE
ncbi:MAG: acyl-CoA dehydratase activase [Campylobacterota bacterium]|nr:acyl-CoA dehydratase activase [Campylobacterota bacterium]